MKNLAILLAAAISISACNKGPASVGRLNCPAYDPTPVNTWFPYEQGKTYYYKANDTSTHWLEIQQVKYTNGDEMEGWVCEAPTICLPGATVFAGRDIEQYDKIWLSALHTHRPTGDEFTLAWNSTNTELIMNEDGSLSLNPVFYDRPEDYYQQIKPDFVYHSQQSLNEVAYNDVYEITFNNNDMGNAHKIYLVKNHGIVGYQTQDGLEYWLQK